MPVKVNGPLQMIRATREERKRTMAESGEERASHEEVEAFVGKLREFHGSLSENEQGMMDEVLDSAQGGETAGYRRRQPRSGEGSEESWNDLVGWIEDQGDDDTQGFRIKIKR